MPNEIVKKLSDLMSLPLEVMTGIPVFTLRGREEVEADGCTGILEYTPTRVVLAVKRDKVTIAGEELTLTDFRNTVLTVRGRILSVTYGEAE